MDWKAKWLRPASDFGNAAPVFSTDFALSRTVKQARLFITALGVYEAALNGRFSLQHHVFRHISLKLDGAAYAAHHAVASRADTG